MAIAVDQSSIGTNGVSGSDTTVVLTTSAAVASGGFIVLGVGWWASSVTLSSVSGGGLSWSIDKQGHAGSPAFPGVALVSAQAPSGLASSTAITATYSGTTPSRMIGGMSFLGVATSSPVDGTPVGPTGVATAAWSTGNMTLADGSAAVALNFIETVTDNTPSQGTEVWEIATGDNLVMQYRIEATGGTFTLGGTWGSATGNTNIGVAYLAAASDDTGLAWIVA